MAIASNRTVTRPMPRRGRIVAILDGDLDSFIDGAPASAGHVDQRLGSTGLMRIGVINGHRVGRIGAL